MAFQLADGVFTAGPFPTDRSRYLASDVAARNTLIGAGRAFPGLQVFTEDEGILYILLGATNDDWYPLAYTGGFVTVVGDQEVAGTKTYVDPSIWDTGGNNFTTATPEYFQADDRTTGNNSRITADYVRWKNNDTGFITYLRVFPASDDRTLFLPDKTGILAVTSDIPVVTGFVPYTGATQDVDLGDNKMTLGERQETAPFTLLYTDVLKGRGYSIGGEVSYSLLRTMDFHGNGSSYNVFSSGSLGLGYNALGLDNGLRCTAIGTDALSLSTGERCTAIGVNSLAANTGDSCVGIGNDSGTLNTANYLTTIGKGSGTRNTGVYGTFVGFQAGSDNEGVYVTGIGANVVHNNLGSYVVAIGTQAGNTNLGDNVTLAGHQSGKENSANQLTAYGYDSGRYNEGANNTFIGANAHAEFYGDPLRLQSVVDYSTDIDVTNNIFTLPDTSDLGSVGAYVSLLYTVSGDEAGGMFDNTIYRFLILSGTQIEYQGNIYDTGTGGTHSFTPQTTYTNSMSLGANSRVNKDNQIVLGDANVDSVVMGNGDVIYPLVGTFVPYVGATEDVDLGNHDIKAQYAILGQNVGSSTNGDSKNLHRTYIKDNETNEPMFTTVYKYRTNAGPLVDGNSLGVGSDALSSSATNDVVAVGTEACQAGMNVLGTFIGMRTGRYALGDNTILMGHNTGTFNASPDVIYIGNNIEPDFIQDTARTKIFTETDTDLVNQTITLPSHGLGVAGEKIILYYDSTGGLCLPVGERDFIVLDADTIEFLGSLDSAGSGVQTLIPQHEPYTNTIAIGHGAIPTKPNQVVLGNSDAVEVIVGDGAFVVDTTRDATLNGVITFAETVQAPDYAGLSDIRKKDVIGVLEAKPLDTQYIKYTFKGDSQVRIGLSAQQVQEKHPEFVRTDKDGFLSLSYSDIHNAEIAYLKNKSIDDDEKIKVLEERLFRLEELMKTLL